MPHTEPSAHQWQLDSGPSRLLCAKLSTLHGEVHGPSTGHRDMQRRGLTELGTQSSLWPQEEPWVSPGASWAARRGPA